MADISTWSATDNANTAAPPNGWPEGQQASSVNDCARAMMGATRRWYDQINATIGSTPGTISTTIINATTISTTGAITASGPITGTAINSSGNGSIAGTLTAGGVSTGNLNAGGTVTAAQLTSTGNINASGGIGASGNISGNGLYGAYVNSSGNIDAAGGMSANVMTANGITSNGNLSVAGQITTGPFYTAGTYGIGNWKFYVTNEIWCARHIIPVSDGGVYCGLVAFPWAGVFAYSYTTSSDPALKHDIEPVPPGCLDLVNAIEPKTYKLNLEADEGRTHWGFLAPDVGEVMRRAGLKFDGARDDGDGRASLAYDETIAILWKAVQELAQQVNELKREKADV